MSDCFEWRGQLYCGVLGLVMYFKYGIKNSTLETDPAVSSVVPLPPNPLERTTLPPPSPRPARPAGDRNIFEGDGNDGFFGNVNSNLYGNPANADMFDE